jgi:hypothetical protein
MEKSLKNFDYSAFQATGKNYSKTLVARTCSRDKSTFKWSRRRRIEKFWYPAIKNKVLNRFSLILQENRYLISLNNKEGKMC